MRSTVREGDLDDEGLWQWPGEVVWVKPNHNKRRRKRRVRRGRLRRRLLASIHGNRCYVCGCELVQPVCGQQPASNWFTVDHVIPRSRGGPDSLENCRPACHRCNQDKGDGMPPGMKEDNSGDDHHAGECG